MYKIVLLRHGESVWNKENRFTGWTYVDLTDKGREEAAEAGKSLKKEGFVFDLAFTSVLKKLKTQWKQWQIRERSGFKEHCFANLPCDINRKFNPESSRLFYRVNLKINTIK